MISFSATYKAQCQTYAVAKQLAGDSRNVSRLDEIHKPPFCLRLLPAYRTPSVQQFRDEVAARVRAIRKEIDEEQQNEV